MKYLEKKMSEFKKDLARRLSEDLQEFAKREDFDPGEFCSTITRFAISLNYDFSDCPVTAAGMIAMCWEQEMRNIKVEMNEQETSEEMELKH